MGDIPAVFAYLGLLVFLLQLRKVADYFWFHFLRPASYQKFLHGASPYAIITGSSDGIGKSLAKVLYAKGFNLILHGRNEEKMKKVVGEIQALHNRRGGEIKYFIADASEQGHDFEAIAKNYEDLNITLLINNVGGAIPVPKTIDKRLEIDSRRTLNLNLDFPLFLTRAFLPQLRRISQSTGPAEVVFVGSLAGEVSVPFICAYSGSKIFLKRAARILYEEERALYGSNLSFMYLNVGEVRSSGLGGEHSFARPLADEFAKGVVKSLGCGRRVVIPWYSHNIMIGILSLIPESLLDRFARRKTTALLKDIVRPKD